MINKKVKLQLLTVAVIILIGSILEYFFIKHNVAVDKRESIISTINNENLMSNIKQGFCVNVGSINNNDDMLRDTINCAFLYKDGTSIYKEYNLSKTNNFVNKTLFFETNPIRITGLSKNVNVKEFIKEITIINNLKN